MRKLFYVIIVCILGFVVWKYYLSFKLKPNVIVNINAGTPDQWKKAIENDRLFENYLKRLRKKYPRNAPYYQFDVKTETTKAATVGISNIYDNNETTKQLAISSIGGPIRVIKNAAIALTIAKGESEIITKNNLDKACEMALNAPAEDQLAILNALHDKDISKSPVCSEWLIKFAKAIPPENREIMARLLMAQASLPQYKTQAIPLCVDWIQDKNPQVAKSASVILTTTSRGDTAKYLLPLLRKKDLAPTVKVLIIETISFDKKLSEPARKILQQEAKTGGAVATAATEALAKHNAQ